MCFTIYTTSVTNQTRTSFIFIFYLCVIYHCFQYNGFKNNFFYVRHSEPPKMTTGFCHYYHRPLDRVVPRRASQIPEKMAFKRRSSHDLQLDCTTPCPNHAPSQSASPRPQPTSDPDSTWSDSHYPSILPSKSLSLLRRHRPQPVLPHSHIQAKAPMKFL